MQEHSLIKLFRNQLLFSGISQYLDIKQVLNLATVCQQLKEAVEQFCKSKMVELNLKPSSHKSYIHQMQFYFNRCLRISRRDDRKMDEHLVTIDHPFKFQTIHDFEVGTTFTCYLTRDHKARIFRTSALLNYYDEAGMKKEKPKNEPPSFADRQNIKQVKSKSDKCVLLKLNGEVSVVATNKNEEQIITEQEPIDWTARIPIERITNSFAYTLFHPEGSMTADTIFSEVFSKKWEKKEEEGEHSYMIGKNMINNKQFLIQLPCAEVIEATVGSRFAYFISEKNDLLEADLEEKPDQTNLIIVAKHFEPLKGKTIAKIANGYNYFIALERKMEQIQEWDTQRVVEWLKEIGFEAYIKIARAQKLNGKKLKSIERKYMHNALGITTQNMQQKFIMSIEQVLHKKQKNDQLWGWGKNDNGQLGSSSANFIGRPQKIRLTCVQQGEYIDSIFCGWFQTFIRTQKGRIYCTKINNAKKRKGSEYNREQEVGGQGHETGEEKMEMKRQLDSDFENDSAAEEAVEKGNRKRNKGNPQKKKRKNLQAHNLSLKQREKQSNNRKFEEEENWSEFELGKAFLIQTYKDVIFVIQCPNQQREEPNRMKRLRTAKAVLDKILWSSLNKEEFKVGYMDKDMGLIEASAVDMQKFDVKQNRIKYFKRNNTIVWDRENKIDNF